MCSRAELKENVVFTACQVYRTAFARSDWKQRKHANFGGVLAACVFHACNVHRVPRTPVELCRLLDTEVRNMRKMVKTVQHAADAVAAEHRRVQVLNVETDLVPRYLCMLGVTGAALQAIKRACVAIYRAKRALLDNHRPETIAACLICAAMRPHGDAHGADEANKANEAGASGADDDVVGANGSPVRRLQHALALALADTPGDSYSHVTGDMIARVCHVTPNTVKNIISRTIDC
jgi:transcription initiation factor TFIIIB Brf1 subunit/transcription initiation factor TFIIB